MLCNLYGDAHTGKKTIANYIANLLVSKKLYKRIVAKIITSLSAIRDSINGQHD